MIQNVSWDLKEHPVAGFHHCVGEVRMVIIFREKISQFSQNYASLNIPFFICYDNARTIEYEKPYGIFQQYPMHTVYQKLFRPFSLGKIKKNLFISREHRQPRETSSSFWAFINQKNHSMNSLIELFIISGHVSRLSGPLERSSRNRKV